jgi:hypothetical protein
MWLGLITTLLCLFISTPSFASGTGVGAGTDQHVLGIVMAIDEKHIEVKTPKGPVDLQINKKTRFKDGHNPKGFSLPEVGDRVIIMATKIDKKGAKKGDPLLVATEIHFSTGKRIPASVEPAPVE